MKLHDLKMKSQMLLILNRRQEVLITSAANPFVYLMNKHFTEALTSVG